MLNFYLIRGVDLILQVLHFCINKARPISQDYPLEQKIERLLRIRRRKIVADATINTVGKQSILSDQDTHGNQNACNNQNALDNQNVAARDDAIQVEKHVLVRGRSIRDNMLLNLDDLKPSIITPKIQAAQFELKPVMFTMLDFIGQFGSSPHEDARQHVRAFLEVCSSFHQQGVHEDVLNLKLFPYSLRDRARMWLNSASPGSLQSWVDLCQSFLLRYNPPNMNARFRNEITSFRQADDESMYEAWDRYKELFQKCPMHGFNDSMQVEIFYQGVNTPTRMMLDAAANGTILDNSAEEAFEILDRLANNDYQFPSNRRELSQEATLKSLETQVGQFTQMLSARPQDTYIETVPSKEAQVNKYELPVGATTSPNAVASPGKSTKFDKVCKSEEIRLPPPFPQRLRKQKNEYKFKKYLDILKQVHINLPLVEAIEQMPNFAKFLKDIVCKRKKVGKALCDLGANINLMLKSVFQRLCIGKEKPTTVTLHLANGSYVQPEGKIDDILVKLDKFIFPIDFIVLDCETYKLAPIILGKPFLTMGRTLIDAERKQLTMRANDQQVTLNSFKTFKSVDDLEKCQSIRTCSNLTDSKDQSRRCTYAMDNMPKHLFHRDTEIPMVEVNKQSKKNFIMCEETLESLDQEHVDVEECPNEFNQRIATTTVEDHE
ncbi:hypothetical protein GQ457_04G024140 [Hibiscus cannabinus]